MLEEETRRMLEEGEEHCSYCSIASKVHQTKDTSMNHESVSYIDTVYKNDHRGSHWSTKYMFSAFNLYSSNGEG
ncbi:hypothetical protein A4A49_31489 [Nicotiana attenuata]|uniref:Uncharacterized protein n=1 Tax=Nicotiana attenuata TaxID=49451 RepID=A0A1J6KKG6_NICAT|nr:hypothetical protein A4A49_31489 [Nicotiana attenuata]